MNGATITHIYQSTIHLSLQNQLITLGHSIGKAKHHICLDQPIDYQSIDFSDYPKVTISNHMLFIGSLELNIDLDAIHKFEPYHKKFSISSKHLEDLSRLKMHIRDHHPINAFSYNHQDSLLNYQFNRINYFLSHQDFKSALHILGLGMGLTPLGDDILSGFILAKHARGQNVQWLEDVLREASQQTNQFSYQMLMDTYQGFYPDSWIRMIEDFFDHHDIESAKSILNFGATSGAGILTGFIYGLM